VKSKFRHAELFFELHNFFSFFKKKIGVRNYFAFVQRSKMEGSAEDLRRQREEVLGVLRSRQRGCPFTAFGLAALVQVRCAIPSAPLSLPNSFLSSPWWPPTRSTARCRKCWCRFARMVSYGPIDARQLSPRSKVPVVLAQASEGRTKPVCRPHGVLATTRAFEDLHDCYQHHSLDSLSPSSVVTTKGTRSSSADHP